MSGESAATPRPWVLRPVPAEDVVRRYLRTPIEGDQMLVGPNLVSPGLVWMNGDEGDANAALIVTAVNCHDALVDALRVAKRALWNEWHDKPGIGKEDAVAAIDAALSRAGVR